MDGEEKNDDESFALFLTLSFVGKGSFPSIITRNLYEKQSTHKNKISFHLKDWGRGGGEKGGLDLWEGGLKSPLNPFRLQGQYRLIIKDILTSFGLKC